MLEYTFYWKDGTKNVCRGNDVADALNRAGFGNGALRALDFWTTGNDSKYVWEPTLCIWFVPP